jgi:hypothetical protein
MIWMRRADAERHRLFDRVFQRRAETLSDAAVLPAAPGFYRVDCMLDTRYDNAALDEGLGSGADCLHQQPGSNSESGRARHLPDRVSDPWPFRPTSIGREGMTMARDTAEVRPDAIINSKRPSGASPNPARPDLGQGSPQCPRLTQNIPQPATLGASPARPSLDRAVAV